MATITIPRKTFKKAELVVIQRQEYEDLLRARKTLAKTVTVKRSPFFRVPKKHEKFYNKLDKELTEALRDYYKGDSYGPFETAEEAIRFLRRRR